jgi:4-amino-4-deoxy-L-arabinose transferase-like glycosyltransferase
MTDPDGFTEPHTNTALSGTRTSLDGRTTSPRAASAASWRRLYASEAVRCLAIAVVVAAPALTLRLWALDSLGLNSDEAVYAGQGASLAGDPALLPFFPVFRAHPLVFQTLLSLEYRVVGVSPLGGRLLAVAFGMGTVWLTYAIGARLYGRRVGVLASLLIGVMP